MIYTVGIGSLEGVPIPVADERGYSTGFKKNREGGVVMTKLDELTLEKIALETGGKYYRATPGEAELTVKWAIPRSCSSAPTLSIISAPMPRPMPNSRYQRPQNASPTEPRGLRSSKLVSNLNAARSRPKAKSWAAKTAPR